MKKLVEITHTEEETLVSYLTNMIKKRRLTGIAGNSTDGKTDITDVKERIKKLKNRESRSNDKRTLIIIKENI